MRRLVPIVLILAVLAPATAAADTKSPNMELVANFPYEARPGDVPNYGTDVEFATIKGKRYAFAGSELNGLQIFDISRPARTKKVTTYDCAVSQGDVQVFKRAGRTYVTYTNDYEQTAQAATSACFVEARAQGFAVTDDAGASKLGTFVIDVTTPRTPRAVSFVEVPKGSHNMTVHPSGDYLYNSNSELITSLQPAIEVFDIRDLAAPKKAADLAITALPGLGTESHDITFNAAGTRAYSAALSHGVIIDTTDPAAPKVVSEFDDETINVWHQADPVRIGDRELLVVEDELAGAAGPGVCPSGGVHVFDISDEQRPVKVGYWNIDDLKAGDPLGTCTAHVFDIHPEEKVMTIAFYMGGVRVLDLSGLEDAPVGVGIGSVPIGGAIKEIGSYVTEDANTWSAKTPVIEPDGDFYLYGNDIDRGLDVYRFDASAPRSQTTGTFGAPATKAVAGILKTGTTAAELGGDRRLVCLLPALRRR